MLVHFVCITLLNQGINGHRVLDQGFSQNTSYASPQAEAVYCEYLVAVSGVFKGKAPSRCVACKFSSWFGENLIRSYNISDAHHNYALCPQRGPNSSVLCK